jgi:hypothetical protein
VTPSNFSRAGQRFLTHGGCGGSIQTEAERLVCRSCGTPITDPREIINPAVALPKEQGSTWPLAAFRAGTF